VTEIQVPFLMEGFVWKAKLKTTLDAVVLIITARGFTATE
jgi:hypothetical protein